MIIIGNLKNKRNSNAYQIRVDRRSALGNPYTMMVDTEEERNRVCDNYEAWFAKAVKENPLVMNELHRILEIARETDVMLMCWCYPKRCHAETIKRYLEKEIYK